MDAFLSRQLDSLELRVLARFLSQKKERMGSVRLGWEEECGEAGSQKVNEAGGVWVCVGEIPLRNVPQNWFSAWSPAQIKGVLQKLRDRIRVKRDIHRDWTAEPLLDR